MIFFHIPALVARFIVQSLLYLGLMFLLVNFFNAEIRLEFVGLMLAFAALSLYRLRPIVVDMEAQDPARFVEDAREALQRMDFDPVGGHEGYTVFLKKSWGGFILDHILIQENHPTLIFSGSQRDLARMGQLITNIRNR